MQSIQETVLEAFMERSFGATHLFIPKKIYKGRAQKEAADLAWARDGVVILFYMTRSSDSVEAQIEHNLKQAKGYQRLWKTGQSCYVLQGKNRFGDEYSIPFVSVKYRISLSVVSHRCGVVSVQSSKLETNACQLAIPEDLIQWISEFGGTIVDLLHLIQTFLDRISGFTDISHEQQYVLLAQLTQRYVRESFQKADPSMEVLKNIPATDYSLMYDILAKMRMPSSFGNSVQSAAGRAQIAMIFGDMLLIEYASLVVAAIRVISASEPPHFKKWVVLKLDGLYYEFVIGSVHFGARNFKQSFDAVLTASKNVDGITDKIIVVYGWELDSDYRFPRLIGLPPKLPTPHCEEQIKKIMSIIGKVIPTKE